MPCYTVIPTEWRSCHGHRLLCIITELYNLLFLYNDNSAICRLICAVVIRRANCRMLETSRVTGDSYGDDVLCRGVSQRSEMRCVVAHISTTWRFIKMSAITSRLWRFYRRPVTYRGPLYHYQIQYVDSITGFPFVLSTRFVHAWRVAQITVQLPRNSAVASLC